MKKNTVKSRDRRLRKATGEDKGQEFFRKETGEVKGQDIEEKDG